MKINKNKLILLSLFLFLTLNLSALDFNFRPRGFVYLPSSDIKSAGGNDMYSIGGGGDLNFEIDISSVLPNPLGIGYTLGVEGGMSYNGIQGNADKGVSIYSAGGSAGLYLYPLSRLLFRADGAIGAYIPGFDGKTGYTGIYYRYGGELGFRFTPGFTLAANGGMRQFNASEDSANSDVFSSGLYAGLTAQMTFRTGKNVNREAIGVVLTQDEPVYPAFMQLYQKSAIGSLAIRNNENAEIRNVRISFRAYGYTASEFPCKTFGFLARGRKVQVPLLADFSTNILRFTDKGRILGEVVIRYRFLGQEREEVRSVILATNHRNMVPKGDPSALAAFISPNSSDTVDYAKYIAGLAKNDRKTGQNQNLQYAVWLLEGLRAGGIVLNNANKTGNSNDVQFPSETLAFRGGNARDLALLFAACLESVGIPSAFVQTENDFLVAVSMNASTTTAETLFNGTEKILIINDKVWLPLSMTAFSDGFYAAWTGAVKVLGDNFKAGKPVDFVMVEEAWAVYPPAPLPEQGGRVARTDAAAASKEVSRVMQQYVTQEIQPVLTQVQAKVNASPSAALYNRLGIMLVRAGKIPEGKTNYEKAAGMGSIPAMTNRGNLALIEKDYATAERWFKQALSKDSQNAAAIRGLEQVAENK